MARCAPARPVLGGMASPHAARWEEPRRATWGPEDAPAPRAPPALAALQLPDLGDVARRLAVAQFVCVAACYVSKPPHVGASAEDTRADVRILAVGYAAGGAATPELLKVSTGAGFSLMRTWKRRAPRAAVAVASRASRGLDA